MMPSTLIKRWLAVAFLLAPMACDEVHACGFDPGPHEDARLAHEPEIDYETDDGRYTVTIISANSWPPRAGEVTFELWPQAPADARSVQLTADPAFRAGNAEGERPTIPLAPTDPNENGAWQVGPVELDAGVWHVPLRLTDDRGHDAIELRIEVVER
jgi:hypothetical protein